jgi:peptidoglycan/LPS O-acetylase OafA/YrhL
MRTRGFPEAPPAGTRFRELDALRGLAASIVVFDHFQLLWPWEAKPAWLQCALASPLGLLVAGHEAVILFFLLSGFVLTLPYLHPGAPGYLAFLVKRVFRIYVPYLTALVLAVLCDARFHGHVHGFAPWVDRTWPGPVPWHLFWQHVMLLGSYDHRQFNGAFWTLIYEMRISISFPALCLLMAALRLRGSIILAAALSLSGHWFLTLHYAAIFVAGSLLACKFKSIANWYSRLDSAGRVALGLSSGLLFVYGRRAGALAPAGVHLEDFGTVAGALGVVIIALHSIRARRWLSLPLPQSLGTISYSIYLVHVPVLFSLLLGFHGALPVVPFLLAYLGLSLCLALVFHRFVESPSMNAGRRLANLTGPRVRMA